jgi:hypothetical protein
VICIFKGIFVSITYVHYAHTASNGAHRTLSEGWISALKFAASSGLGRGVQEFSGFSIQKPRSKLWGFPGISRNPGTSGVGVIYGWILGICVWWFLYVGWSRAFRGVEYGIFALIYAYI